MGKLISFEEVSAVFLPSRVLILLAKYTRELQKHTGLVIKVSSMNVFKHVESTSKYTEHANILKIHRELLLEVNKQISEGAMQTIAQQTKQKKESKLPEFQAYTYDKGFDSEYSRSVLS